MNKYIIIIILILIIIYLVHSKKNKINEEKFSEAKATTDFLTKLLWNSKISILDENKVSIMQDTGIPIVTNLSGNITIDSQPITTDSNGNITVGNYTHMSNLSILDKTSNRNINTDSSGNITVGDITYNANNTLSNTNMNKNVNIYHYVTKVVLQKIHNISTTDNTLVDNNLTYIWGMGGFILAPGITPTYYPNYYNDLTKYPLNISGLKFQDINNVDISFNKYTTSSNNLIAHSASPIPITSENLYNNMNGTNIFIGYSNNTPAPVNGDIHSYTFTFTQPQLIKKIIIANRKDGYQNGLNNATLLIYGKNSTGKEVLLKSIHLNNFETNPYYTPGTFFTKSITTPAPQGGDVRYSNDYLPRSTTPQQPLTVNLYPN